MPTQFLTIPVCLLLLAACSDPGSGPEEKTSSWWEGPWGGSPSATAAGDELHPSLDSARGDGVTPQFPQPAPEVEVPYDDLGDGLDDFVAALENLLDSTTEAPSRKPVSEGRPLPRNECTIPFLEMGPPGERGSRR